MDTIFCATDRYRTSTIRHGDILDFNDKMGEGWPAPVTSQVYGIILLFMQLTLLALVDSMTAFFNQLDASWFVTDSNDILQGGFIAVFRVLFSR